MGAILVTGSTGFIGKNLIKHISKFDRSAIKSVVLLGGSQTNEFASIPYADYQINSRQLKSGVGGEIETVVLLGGFTVKDSTYLNDPRNFVGVISTEQLLNSLPNSPRNIIYVSTVDVYSHTEGPISEDSPTQPNGFYGQSKLYTEQVVKNWCVRHNVVPQILRLGHIYGPGEDAYQKLIPQTIRKILQGERPVVFSSGKEKRSFLHVSDCVKALWDSIKLKQSIGTVNVASGVVCSVLDIVRLIRQVSGKAIDIEVLNRDVVVYDYIFDIRKMQQFFSESIDLHQGLTDEYRYFQNILSNNSI